MNIAGELKVFAKDLSILIVEDDVELNQELVAIAKIFFKHVASAYDGQEGLEVYTKEHFDIVMSDITMPFVNGVNLSKQIKNINEHQNIVILSAHSEVSYMIDLVDIGIRQFVHKPFDDQELLYRLLKVAEELVVSRAAEANAQSTIAKMQEKTLEVPQQTKEMTSVVGIAHESVNASSFNDALKSDEVAWSVMEEEISVILELKEDLEHYVGLIFSDKVSKEVLYEISSVLRKMYTSFSQIDSMKNMTLVLFELASFIEEVDYSQLSQEQMEKFKIIEFFYDDIARFIETVFVYKDTIDVFYLEDSLRSSVTQLKHSVLQTQIEEEEFELF